MTKRILWQHDNPEGGSVKIEITPPFDALEAVEFIQEMLPALRAVIDLSDKRYAERLADAEAQKLQYAIPDQTKCES